MYGPIESHVVYDVEVMRGPEEVDGGWDNPEGMGLASAVVYSYADDQYRFFVGPESREQLLKQLNGKTVVSFNGIKFDSRVILGNTRALSGNYTSIPSAPKSESAGWWNVDLLLEYIQKRFGLNILYEAEAKLGDKTIHDGSFGLDGLAQGTFGLRKTGHGAEAPFLYRMGKISELLAYNLHDVRLTKKLFDFARQYGFLVDRDGRAIRIF